jgi:hypothetical protein
MSSLYGPIHRTLQERFDTRRLADNVEKRVVLTEIPPEHKTFIESRDMFFLSTIDHQGRPTSNAMSALPPKADMCSAAVHVRFGPIADITQVTGRCHQLGSGCKEQTRANCPALTLRRCGGVTANYSRSRFPD